MTLLSEVNNGISKIIQSDLKKQDLKFSCMVASCRWVEDLKQIVKFKGAQIVKGCQISQSLKIGMKRRFVHSGLLLSILLTLISNQIAPVSALKLSLTHNSGQTYTFPDETEEHEATWLQWPHQHQYGETYRDSLQPIWVDMAKAIAQSETVRIIVYDDEAKTRVQELLQGVSGIEYFVYPTDDVWVRDNGPIFARNSEGKLVIEDWGFNAWGRKAQYKNCDKIPALIGRDLGFEVVPVPMINEGGSVEVDGHGTLIGCKSSISNANRNPGKTLAQIEAVFREFYGVSNFVWLEGVAGKDITDMHIDGFARFVGESTLITMSEADLEYWQVPAGDIRKLRSASNARGDSYTVTEVPLTLNDVVTSAGKNVGRASYINFYIANSVVVVPNYGDPNDAVANGIIAGLYPTREVRGVKVNDLFANGGMVHCVTQQQPKA